MSCRDFETVLVELARGQVTEAGLRNAALAHAGGCSGCSQRLADEQALSAGLRALAGGFQNEHAPARIETALLAAFRNPARAGGPERSTLHRMLRPVAAAAAVVLLALGIAFAPGRPPSIAQAPAPRGERATEFIPLLYGNPPPERGHVVRIRMSRSALVPFGFPMNPERAFEPVNADVLVGEDGLARAIRFVY
jgi:hypothetical protein